ncbi:MAG: HU family DNA-binding protein [Balneolaceae bacterium]|nr:MAG: HU family DNA-binding protein [Balneolaceae bacterium]
MNYKQLIDRLSEKSGNSKVKTKELVQDTVDVLTKQLCDGKGVSIPDLGTFSTKVSDEKKVYNPHYDAYMMVPPKRVVEFSPAAGLKEEIKFLETRNE